MPMLWQRAWDALFYAGGTAILLPCPLAIRRCCSRGLSRLDWRFSNQLEITSVNEAFLKKDALKVQTLGRGFAWLDTGTHDSLSEASTFVETLEKRQGLKIACLEEIGFHQGWITKEKLQEIGEFLSKNQYGQYLLSLLKNKR